MPAVQRAPAWLSRDCSSPHFPCLACRPALHRYGLEQFEQILDRLDEMDPQLLLEPMAHTEEGGSTEKQAMQWYYRHQLREEARASLSEEARGRGGMHADEGGEERSANRIARRVRRAQHKALLRERHAAREVCLSKAKLAASH